MQFSSTKYNHNAVAPSPLSSSRMFSSPQMETPPPLAIIPHNLVSPSPWQTLICCLYGLYIDRVWKPMCVCLYTVDLWTTWVWIVLVHLHVDFFFNSKYNTTWPLAVESTDEEPWIQRHHRFKGPTINSMWIFNYVESWSPNSHMIQR